MDFWKGPKEMMHDWGDQRIEDLFTDDADQIIVKKKSCISRDSFEHRYILHA